MNSKKLTYYNPSINIVDIDFQVVCIGDSLGDKSEGDYKKPSGEGSTDDDFVDFPSGYNSLNKSKSIAPDHIEF
ncbi:MAG: hypothetical protein Q4C30_05935 [Bacteroidia bacterium]|nr:hypothetical protein [Bacteroidia bacterium]